MSSDGRRRVAFDSPPGGSKSSSRHNSDSGVGSGSSDHRPAATNPDRGFTDRDIERQWNDLGALQSAYRALYDSEKRLKSKLRDLDEENNTLRRRVRDEKDRADAAQDEITKLKEDMHKMDDDRKSLATDGAQLRGKSNQLATENDELRDRVRDLERELEAMAPRRVSPRSSEVPMMAGANPEARSSKPSRRDSVSKKRDTKEKEAKKEKDRLSKRFDLKDGEATSKPPNSSRTRRNSVYIEPLGSAAPARSAGSSIPPSPITTTAPSTRQFSTYREATYNTTYAQPREPTYSDLPRTVLPSVHPSVTVHEPVFADEGVAWKEDGSYYPHPLPKPPKSSSRHHSKYSTG